METPEQKPPDKAIIVCTKTEIFDAVDFIAGQKMPIKRLLQPGVDPRTHKLTLADNGLVAEADAVLMNGLNLEAEMSSSIHEACQRAVVELSNDERIQKLGTVEKQDPFCWFNPENFQIYVDRAPDAVLQVKPGHRDIFLDRAQAYKRKLARPYEDMKTMVAQVEAPDRIVITNQDTFACLGKRL